MKENEEFLVDTNILVYAYDTSQEEKHAKAKEIVEKVWREGGGVATMQNLGEFVFIVTRKVKNPIPIAEAKKIVEGIRDSTKWRVLDRTFDTFLKGIELYEEKLSTLLSSKIKRWYKLDTPIP